MQWRLRVNDLATLSFGGNNLLNQKPALWTPAFERQMFAGLSIHWAAAEK
jgi:outer membrane receptor protein involved in Fe transport